MKIQEKIFRKASTSQQAARMVETIVGCKWSLTVYQLLEHGINRPGEMVRCVEGLSTKVLNDCLRKNISFGIIDKQTYLDTPVRVEYSLTEFGRQFINILDGVEKLQKMIDTETIPQPD